MNENSSLAEGINTYCFVPYDLEGFFTIVFEYLTDPHSCTSMMLIDQSMYKYFRKKFLIKEFLVLYVDYWYKIQSCQLWYQRGICISSYIITDQNIIKRKIGGKLYKVLGICFRYLEIEQDREGDDFLKVNYRKFLASYISDFKDASDEVKTLVEEIVNGNERSHLNYIYRPNEHTSYVLRRRNRNDGNVCEFCGNVHARSEDDDLEKDTDNDDTNDSIRSKHTHCYGKLGGCGKGCELHGLISYRGIEKARREGTRNLCRYCESKKKGAKFSGRLSQENEEDTDNNSSIILENDPYDDS
jgi:hypothetical protein